MSSPPVVFLVGFMGSGKSAVGRHLAPLLHVRFIDLDEQITRRDGREVRAIFRESGEPAFRALERSALFELEPLLASGAVVATGGGAFADPELRAWMLARGVPIWLDADLDAIERRVARDDSRPLSGDRATLERLMAQRRSAYAEAPLRFDSGGADPADVAHAIERALAPRDEG